MCKSNEWHDAANNSEEFGLWEKNATKKQYD